MGGVKAFTNPALAQMLVSEIEGRRPNNPKKYFQVVLSVKAMDDVPVEISYYVAPRVGRTRRPACPARSLPRPECLRVIPLAIRSPLPFYFVGR